MENENKVEETTIPTEVVETTTVEETVETPKTYSEKEFKEVLARAKKAEADAKLAKARPPVVKTTLDVGDYIDISASLEGLDSREKEYLAKQHKMTGQPLTEIRKSEDFNFWQSSYRQKAEKEKASLAPSTKQPDDDSPISMEEALSNATTIAEKEKILSEAYPDFARSLGKQSNPTRVKLG